MKATPKADECIRMIQEIEIIGLFFIPRKPITDEFISKIGDKKSDYFKSMRLNFDGLAYNVNYFNMLLKYRLLPFQSFNIRGNNSFKNVADDEKAEFLTFAAKHTKDDINILWEALRKYDEITLDNLKSEFWDILTGLENVDEYYQVVKMKYQDVFSNIPDKDYYNYFRMKEDKTVMTYFDSLVRCEIVTHNEVDELLFRTSEIVEELDRKCTVIVEMYKSFIAKTTEDYSGEISDQQNKQQPPIDSTKEMDLDKENIILEINDTLIPKYITLSDKEMLSDLLTKNNAMQKINWIGSHEALMSTVNNWHQRNIVSFLTGQDSKSFCTQHFLIKGNEIKKGSLANAATKTTTRYNS